MKIIKANYEILDQLNGEEILKKIELCGRVCYKSENKITAKSAEKFARDLIVRGHESVLEHFSFSVRFIVDRGVSHELVRHRVASFSQESTRYCRYNNRDITFIQPFSETRQIAAYSIWHEAMRNAAVSYSMLVDDLKISAQEARSVLPNSLKTEIIMTANLREWRHFFKLRTSAAAHPQMREITIPLLAELKEKIPGVFDDIDLR